MTNKLIRISDPDQPIYRIFPLWFFEEALRLKYIVLVNPGLWEDPMEIVGGFIVLNQIVNGKLTQVTISEPFTRIFAQCWSSTEESDTLLRAYSRVVKDPHFGRNIFPREEGVRVRSTARKLLSALEAGTQDQPKGQCYIGSVQYMAHKELLQYIANGVGEVGKTIFDYPDNLANLALLKRQAFSHESEVRLMFISDDPTPASKLRRVQIDPNEIFDEIAFDPRIGEQGVRENVVRDLGYTGKIVGSELYKRLELIVQLPDLND